MGDEMHRRDPSCAGLLKDFHTAWAHCVIARRRSKVLAFRVNLTSIKLHA
jgi:hypothetical protein